MYRGDISQERISPRVGFEPTTNRLTADRSTTELSRNRNVNTTIDLDHSIVYKKITDIIFFLM